MTNEQHTEAMYDRYDDSGVHSADELRAMTGYEGHDASDFTSDAMLGRNPELQFHDNETNETDDRRKWIDALHLTDPSHEGPIERRTSEQRAEASRRIRDLKQIPHPEYIDDKES